MIVTIAPVAKQSMSSLSASAASPDAFVMVVDTNNTGYGGTDNLSFQIPTATSDTVYNYNVDCNDDGVFEASNLIGDYTCVYATPGIYTVAITGSFPRVHFRRWGYDAGDTKKLIEIKQWGTQVWQSMAEAFYDTSNMTMTATDSPNLTAVTDMSYMFNYCINFNQDISGWDTSAVTNMSGMFFYASAFNNGGVALDWVDTSKVTDMSYMFYGASAFNQDVSSWNTSSVIDMSNLFAGLPSFNQDISDWDTSSVTNMECLFCWSDSFNQDISGWDVSKVTNMDSMFFETYAFNQDISSWDTSSVTEMNCMFWSAWSFNQDISGWDTSSVIDMTAMFYDAQAFNQDISGWDTSSVTEMTLMFASASAFNQDISNWNTGNVIDMGSMFELASSFDQDISGWDISKVTSFDYYWYDGFMFGGRLSSANYDKLLQAWPAKLNPAVTSIDFGSSRYCDTTAHANMATKLTTSFIDGGPSTACSVPVPVITSPTPDQIIVNSEVEITGTATPGQTVRLRLNNQIYDLIVDPLGRWSQTATGLTNGAYNISASILVDGIDESASTGLTFTVTDTPIDTSTGTPTVAAPKAGVGANQLSLIIIAGLLLVIGTGGIFLIKKNRSIGNF